MELNDYQNEAIQHALDYLRKRQELYAEWNTIYDSLKGGDRDAALKRIDSKIAAHERHAVVELHNLLFKFGAVDKPMAD